MIKKTSRIFALCLALCLIFGTFPISFAANRVNNWVPYEQIVKPATGIRYADGQVFPTFSEITSGTVYFATVSTSSSRIAATNDERIAISTLAGIVNRTKPRFYYSDQTTWRGAAQIGISNRYTSVTGQNTAAKWNMIKEFLPEVSGVVLYSTSRSAHYRNLAQSIANTMNAIPMIQSTYDSWATGTGVSLPILADITGLTMTTEVDIYQYLYDNYWAQCSRKVIISHATDNYANIRDYSAAVGAAVIYLESRANHTAARSAQQAALLRRFLGDMPPGKSILLGWQNERGLASACAEAGIGMVPADFSQGLSFLAGTSNMINIPEIPNMPVLDDTMYGAIFVTDGDNTQFVMGDLRDGKWAHSTRTAASRTVPMNWTMSPAFVDIAPGVLNYYYDTSTPYDTLVTGPSGMGYAMFANTLYDVNDSWYPLAEDNCIGGPTVFDMSKVAAFAGLSDSYAERAGMRVITAWDEITSPDPLPYDPNWPRYSFSSANPTGNGPIFDPSNPVITPAQQRDTSGDPPQRETFSAALRFVQGVTVQDFVYWRSPWESGAPYDNNYRWVFSSVKNNTLFQKLTPNYWGNADPIQIQHFTRQFYPDLDTWSPYADGAGFTAGAFNGWNSQWMRADRLQTALNTLNTKYNPDGKYIKFVRADHFYNLYYEANFLPVDLTYSPKVQVTATSNNADADLVQNGTASGRIWEAAAAGPQSLTFDLGETWMLNRYVLRNAEANYRAKALNTKDWNVEVSLDGTAWTTVDAYEGNTLMVADIEFENAIAANYVRFNITDPGADGIARVAELQLYATVADMGVNILDSDIAVSPGQSFHFSAGKFGRAADYAVEWSVAASNPGTVISAGGLLAVDPDEPAGIIKVSASVKVPGFDLWVDTLDVVVGKYKYAPLSLSTGAHNVKPGDYFTLNAAFTEKQKSNAAILNYSFDGSKFEYAGFTPASGVQVLNTDYGSGFARITVSSMNYDLKEFGDIMLRGKEDAIFSNGIHTVSVSVNYVLLDEDDGSKSILVSGDSARFTTIGTGTVNPPVPGDTNGDGIVNLIDLSNMIDWFGKTPADAGWYDLYIFFDFNNNSEIDISDIAYVARLI